MSRANTRPGCAAAAWHGREVRGGFAALVFGFALWAPAVPAADPAPAAAAPAPAPAASSARTVPDREAALAARLPQLAAPGEAVTLEAEGAKFFGFYRAGERKPPAAALLIVPAIGEFIDQDAVIRELRRTVPRDGFATLAIQPPLPAPAADPAAYQALAAPLCARVKAGLAHLTAQGHQRYAIAAAASSADAMPGCVRDVAPTALMGFAALGPWAGTLADLKIPVLDIVPTREPGAVKAADARRTEARTAQPARAYRRADIEGMARDYRGAETEVAAAVRGWLKKLATAPAPPAVKAAAAPPEPSPVAGKAPASVPVKR